MLVPTGRGKYIIDQEISAKEYEETLNWFYDQREKTPLQLKATCAPHYYRILRQRAKEDGKIVTFESHGLDAVTRGCLGGTGFCFISHTGIVQPCGFLHIECGDVTKNSFEKIWNSSEVFLSLRNFDKLKGKCGICEFKRVCGGCRARAYEATGDYMAEEPLCSYEPVLGMRRKAKGVNRVNRESINERRTISKTRNQTIEVNAMKIKSLMIPDPITITENSSISEAIGLMKLNSIRHLPVVGRNKILKGFVTLADLKQGLIPSMIGGLSLDDLMIKNP